MDSMKTMDGVVPDPPRSPILFARSCRAARRRIETLDASVAWGRGAVGVGGREPGLQMGPVAAAARARVGAIRIRGPASFARGSIHTTPVCAWGGTHRRAGVVCAWLDPHNARVRVGRGAPKMAMSPSVPSHSRSSSKDSSEIFSRIIVAYAFVVSKNDAVPEAGRSGEPAAGPADSRRFAPTRKALIR